MKHLKKRKKNILVRRSKNETLIGLSFILPNFIGFSIFVLIPVVFSLVLSVLKWDGFRPAEFVGFANFIEIFTDKYFLAALGRTFIYSISCVILTTLASLALAVLLNRSFFLRGLARSAIYFPYIASIVAVAVVWNMLFQPEYGPINSFLRLIGIANPPGWTATTKWSLPAVIIVTVWKQMGYYMIIYLAALQNIPKELHEAAAMDGAKNFQLFWKVIFPMLSSATFFVVLMTTINSFKSWDLIYNMTEGGPGQATTMISHFIFNKTFIYNRYGIASAAAMVLFIIVATITIIQFRIEKKASL